MGITALISTLLGMLGGAIPDLLKEWKDQRQHRREVEFQEKLHAMQLERAKIEAGAKVAEAEANYAAEEVRAMRESLVAIIEQQGKPTGIAWIDGFNALIRPVCALLVMILFGVTAAAFVTTVLQQYANGQITDAKVMAETIWSSQIGLAIEGVLGFLFGARQVRRA